MAHRLDPYPDSPPAAETSLVPAEVLGRLWRRKWTLVGFVAACMTLGAVYCLVAPRTYMVSSRVLVQRQGMPNDPNKELATTAEFLATQGEIIRSRAVLERVAKALDLPPRGATEPDPVLKLLETLTVKPVVGTNILNITYGGPDETRSLETARLILANYSEFLREREQGSQVEALRLVTQHEVKLRKELETLDNQYLDLRRASPLIGEGRDSVQEQRTRLTRLGDALTNARLRRIDLENRLEAVPKSGPGVFGTLFQPPVTVSGQEGSSRTSALPVMTDTLTAEAKTIQPELLRAQAQERQLRQVHGYGPNHPEVRSAKEAIRVYQDRLHEVEHMGREAIQLEFNAAQIQEKQLADLYREEYKSAKAVEDYLVKEQQTQGEIQRVQNMHDSVVAQIKQMQLLDQSLTAGRLGVAISVLEAPVLATPTIFPPAPLVLGLCGLLGLVGGAGWATLLERRAVEVHATDTDGQSSRPVYPRPAAVTR
jgi:uncharacterized protein involved in exopolysaccharide biosynthesis